MAAPSMRTQSSLAPLQVSISFDELRDPRVVRTRRHPLINVLVVVLAGVLSGMRGWDAMAVFALGKSDLLSRFLDMSAGVPSADTLRRVFERLDPKVFAECFAHWAASIAHLGPDSLIAIDGKSQQGHTAPDRRGHQSLPIVHMVTAWASERRIVLAALSTARAATEPVQIKELLELFEMRGATVTVDAIACRGDAVARAIRAKGAHYLITLKGNSKCLYGFVVRGEAPPSRSSRPRSCRLGAAVIGGAASGT